jgi:hypothetical protein
MRFPLRFILIVAATFVPVGGCVTQPPQPETKSPPPPAFALPTQGNSGAGAAAAGGGRGAGGAVAALTTSDGAAKSGADQTAEAPGSMPTKAPEKTSESRSSRTSKRGETQPPHAGDLKSDKGAGGPNGNASVNGNGAVANELPDGNDDDVVARRLRKAAEQETDPELKDKLWKEYGEYKKNAKMSR